MSECKKGSQRPTLLHEPPDAVDWTISDIAVEFAFEVGYVLDEWQQWLVRWAFVRRPDGLWAARDYCIEVARQNGKNIVLEVIEVVAVFLLGEDLVIHSAHRTDVSHEHFLSLKAHIEASNDLMDAMPLGRPNNGFITANGKESIELANGNRILFKSRQSGSGRGPRPKRIVFDEALILPMTAVGDMAPGMSAQRNPQVVFASSPPKRSSDMLHALRARAIEPAAGDRLFFAGWINPPETTADDTEAELVANPSLGYGRMTHESLRANRKLMSHEDYMREHMGVPEEFEAHEQVIPEDLWAQLADSGSRIESNRAWSVTVSPDLKWSSIGVAGRTVEGRYHVEWMEHRAGTGWIVDRVVSGFESKRLPVRVSSSAAEKFLIPKLRERGVEVDEVTAADEASATGDFIAAAVEGQLRHLDQPSLNKALRGAVLKVAERGSSLWSERSSSVEITPLRAVTVALGGVPTEQPFTGDYFADLDDFGEET